MRNNIKRKITSVLLIVLLLLTSIVTSAHSGRTDSSGGHKDNKNKSGLGSYHYHCGGNPPHLHKDGKCPYKSTSTTTITTKTTTTSTSDTNQKESIKAIQSKLNELGYNCGEVDGSIGPKTRAAIKAFQKDKDLDVDGIVGPITRKALGL